MRLIPFGTVVAVLAFPTVARPEAYSEEGNKPQPASNYKDLPGVIDLVNQPSRQLLQWINGAESFSYSGDTDALNHALQLFTKIDSSTHRVILRPGPLYDKYDWQIHIVQGIARAGIKHHNTESVQDVAPTFVIYVSDKLKLDSLVIPANVQVQQISDLRTRYMKAQQSGNNATKRVAARSVKAIDEDPVLKALGKTKYHEQVRQISEFISTLPANK